MAAFTSVTQLAKVPAPAGGDGLAMAAGTAVPTASYDTGGSVIDMSAIFKKTCRAIQFSFGNADFRFDFVPTATTFATATGVVFIDDNAGTEASSSDNVAASVTGCSWVAWGTDA